MQELLTPELVEALIALVSAIVLIATPFLIAYAKRASRALGEMAGVKVSSEHEAMVEKAVRAGVSYAEEAAHKYARGLLDDGPASGAQKREVAKAAARTVAPKALREVSETELEVLIEAEVHQRKRLASIPPGSQLVTIPPPPAAALPPLTTEAIRDHLRDTVAGRPVAKRGEP